MNLRVLQAVGAGPKPATLVLGGALVAGTSAAMPSQSTAEDEAGDGRQ